MSDMRLPNACGTFFLKRTIFPDILEIRNWFRPISLVSNTVIYMAASKTDYTRAQTI